MPEIIHPEVMSVGTDEVTVFFRTEEETPVVTRVGGREVTTTTTDADGHYLFDGLPAGRYTVTATTPDGLQSTIVVGGDPALDSSTDSEDSAPLSLGDTDTSLDFGFWAPQVSVGDYVWFDVNGDGIQDVTDVPLEDVTLTITYPDGSPVKNVYGEDVTTTTTDATGHYLFEHLSALDNVTLAPVHVGKVSRGDATARGQRLLDELDSEPEQVGGDRTRDPEVPALVAVDADRPREPRADGLEALEIGRELVEAGRSIKRCGHPVAKKHNRRLHRGHLPKEVREPVFLPLDPVEARP